MADDAVQVTISGDSTGAVAAAKQVAQSVRDLSEQGKAQIDNLTSAFSKLSDIMIAISAVVAGGALFKDMISSTLETTSAVTGLQKSFGMSLEQANAVKSSLDLLGLSTESYTEMAMKLDRQIKAGSDSLKKMGLTAADLDLGQKGLMDKAIAKLLEYKEGVDRNIAAQVLFGRGGADAIKLVKLSMDGVAEKAHELEEAFGLIVTPQDQANARQYKLVVSEISMAFEGIKKAIGDAVLPYLTAFGNWFVSVAPSVINGAKDTVRSVIDFVFQATQAIGIFVINVGEQIATLMSQMDALKAKAAGAVGGAIAGGIGGALLGGPLGALLGGIGGGALGGIGAGIAAGTSDIEVQTKRFADARKSFTDQVQSFRDVIMNGPKTEGSFGKLPKGTKTANNLLDDGGANKDAIRAQLIESQNEIALAKETLRQKATILDMEVQLGQITQNQKFAQLMQYTEEAYQQEMRAFQQQLEIGNLTLSQRAQVLAKMRLMQEQHNTEMLNLDRQSIQAQAAIWRQYTDTIASSFNSGLRGMLTGQTTFAQASKSLLLDLGLKFIENLVTKPVTEYIAGQLAMVTATQTGAAANAAAATAATAAALPAKVATFTSDITARAAATFAGIFANLSPVLGPAAAAPAAAGEASVLAQLAAVPKFDIGAWSVPRDGLAMIHRGETILPAGAPADAYRASMTGEGGGSGGHTFMIHAIDGPSVDGWLKRGGAAQLAAAVSAHQDKNPSTRRRRGG